MNSASAWELPAYGPRSLREELVNSITHGLGLAVSLIASVLLVQVAFEGDDRWTIVGCLIYAASLVACYTASTLSHVVLEPRRKTWFRMLDQGFIYFLISGTYTPFALGYLRHGWFPLLLAVMWGVAITGFVLKVLHAHRVENVQSWIYVVLGWMPIFGVPGLWAMLPHTVFWWMLAGGLCYTFGVFFLTLDERVPYFHAVWHLMVIAGSVCHFYAIYRYVAPHAFLHGQTAL